MRPVDQFQLTSSTHHAAFQFAGIITQLVVSRRLDMHCKPLFLLLGVVATTLLSIAWVFQTLTEIVTPSGDDRLYYSTMGELPLALSQLTLRRENTHTRGQLSLFQFSQWSILSDQEENVTGGQQGEPMQNDVQTREALHVAADGQQKRPPYQQDDYEVVHDGYEERDIKGETKEARLDFIDNTTDRELDRTPNLSHVLELRKVWKDKGGLVEVEEPIPTVMTEDVNKGAPLNGTEIMEESVTSSISVGRDVIQNTRENFPQKGGTAWISPSTPDSSASKQAFSLPVPFATLPLGRLLQTLWLKELRDYISTLKPHSGPITLVSSDYKYREVLLNWLISALVRVDRPLSNILVLSLDPSLHTLLQDRGFACIHVPPESLLNPVLSASLTRHIAFTQVHVLRLTVMRFLNHWGFDVANYDTDAIIMKNPELLYYKQHQRSDFIGSYGHFPQQLQREWGIAVCIGVVMIKSSVRTGILLCTQFFTSVVI